MKATILAIALSCFLALPASGGNEPRAAGSRSSVNMNDIRNAAYLSVAEEVCGLEVGFMVEQYEKRALASDRRLPRRAVDDAIAFYVHVSRQQALRAKNAFCNEAKASRDSFLRGVEQP